MLKKSAELVLVNGRGNCKVSSKKRHEPECFAHRVPWAMSREQEKYKNKRVNRNIEIASSRTHRNDRQKELAG